MNESSITVASIEQWKNELPISISESTRSLYIMLKAIEKLDGTAGEKYQLLTKLHPIVTNLTNGLSHYCNSKDILNDNQLLIYELANGLYEKMYSVFKSIVDETQHSILHPVLFLHASQSAMHYCIAMLFHAYKYHQQPAAGLWQNLHQLYFICAKKHLHHFNLKKIDAWPYQMNNIENIYKHALLFAIANPYRLRHEQTDLLISALETWVPLLGFDSVSQNSLYFLDPASDLPPRYTSSAPADKENLHYLHLEKIVEHLLKLIHFRKKEEPEKNVALFADAELKIPLPFLNILLSTWQQASTRIAERHKTDQILAVTPTLASVHWLMRKSPSDADEENLKQHIFYTVNVVDESDTGYCIAWPENFPKNLQTGDILGIFHDDPEKKHWEICVIRWIKQDHNAQITLGLQRLSLDSMAATAQPTKTQIAKPIPVLLLPKEEHKPVTLITPLLPFKTGQEIEINFDEKTYLAELKYTREETPGYQEFELNFIDKPLNFPN